LVDTKPPCYSRSLSEPSPSAFSSSTCPPPPPPPLLVSVSSSSHTSSSSSPQDRDRDRDRNDDGNGKPRLDKGFLRSPLWLFGFFLINLGEIGNFLAYGFAPTSLVAPLGMTALVANVFLSPLIVREESRFNWKKDLLGISISLLGGSTVVYASRSSDVKITPSQLIKKLSQPLFLLYSILSIVFMILLTFLSQTKYGDRFVLIDLILCALAGSFTVLSTKALSSFLNSLGLFQTFFKFYYLTYPLLFILLSTAFIQVNFINKSLQRFESRIVIPTQYITFALSSVLGSAVLYGDFKGMTPQELLNFAFGCLISALGVYLLTRDSGSSDSSSDSSASDSENEEEEANNDPTSTTISARREEEENAITTTTTPSSSSSSSSKVIVVDAVDFSSSSSDRRLSHHHHSSSSHISISPTTRIILPTHHSHSHSHSISVPSPSSPSTFLTVTGGSSSSTGSRPGLIGKRSRTLSIGKYRFATGGYLLVASTGPGGPSSSSGSNSGSSPGRGGGGGRGNGYGNRNRNREEEENGDVISNSSEEGEEDFDEENRTRRGRGRSQEDSV